MHIFPLGLFFNKFHHKQWGLEILDFVHSLSVVFFSVEGSHHEENPMLSLLDEDFEVSNAGNNVERWPFFEFFAKYDSFAYEDTKIYH